MAWADLDLHSWMDSTLLSITLDDENTTIRFEFPKGDEGTIICEEFLGISYLGKWDEAVIRKIYACDNSPYLNISQDIIRRNNPLCSLRNQYRDIDKTWRTLVIEMIDGVQIHIPCADVSIQHSSCGTSTDS